MPSSFPLLSGRAQVANEARLKEAARSKKRSKSGHGIPLGAPDEIALNALEQKSVVQISAIPNTEMTWKSAILSGVVSGLTNTDVPGDYKFKQSFNEMFLFCDSELVTPIKRRKNELSAELPSYSSTAIRYAHSGLYIYPAEIFRPGRCKLMELQIRSEQNPDISESKVIETKTLQVIAADFEPMWTKREQ